jgi:hypothetical protein
MRSAWRLLQDQSWIGQAGLLALGAFAFAVAPPLLVGIASLAGPAWTVTSTGVVVLLRE